MPQNDHEKLRSRTRRDSLSTQIADQMTEEIRRGTYTPGSVLPSEHALCDQYQVSRPVVREAFKLLSAQGLVEIQSGKGAIVQEINDTVLRSFFKRLLSKDDPEALIDLLEVRKVLEVKSAEDAAERCSPEELAQLRNILDQMRAQTNNYDAYSRLDVEFHVRLAEFSRNSFLLYLTSSIRDSLVEVINELQIRQYQPELPTIQTFHERIYEALVAGNSTAAHKEMTRHFDEVLTRLHEAIDAGGKQSNGEPQSETGRSAGGEHGLSHDQSSGT